MVSADSSYMEGRAESYCLTIRDAKMRLDRSADNYQEAVQAIDMLGAVRYDRDGGRGYVAHGDDAIMRSIERLYMAGDKVVQNVNEWVGDCEEFDSMCNRISPQSARILSLRYLNGCKWDEVAVKIGYTSEYVRTVLKSRALLELYEVLPKRWK